MEPSGLQDTENRRFHGPGTSFFRSICAVDDVELDDFHTDIKGMELDYGTDLEDLQIDEGQ